MTRNWQQQGKIDSKSRRYKNISYPSWQWYFQPETLIPLLIPWQIHIGRGGEDAHDEDDGCEATLNDATYLYHSIIYTTTLNNVLGRLSIFLSSKSVLVTMAEESRNILILRNSYHSKAEGNFYFQWFVKYFDFYWIPA